ncbi:MAG: hypothetical protein AAB866_00780 [Patescibacteria group bacterium]
MKKEKIVMLSLRLVMGFIFIWAFFDKVFGLGFATNAKNAWINGVSPTYGFLKMATKGPFAEIFHNIAGMAIVDWSFMLGLLFVGLTLIFNRFTKWGCIAGITMMILMYIALLFPINNPIIDEHIVYILVLSLIAIKKNDY